MRRYYNKGSLVGGQVKLDKMGNNDGKISGEDFAVIRSQKMGGGMMKRPMYKDGSKTQDALRAAARDMNKTGQGKKFREATFVDSKTNRIVPDTERNRKRYGKDRVKATTAKGRVKKAGGGGLYANIKAKKDRIAAGSGEKMRKVGTKGAPTAQNFINAAKTAKKV